MKLKFNNNLDYQLEAIKSITDIFQGQTKKQSEFTVRVLTDEIGTEGKLVTDIGIGNKLELSEKDILNNVRSIQLKNALPLSEKIDNNNYKFDIEMETGTGKTYVFLRTIFELNKEYGFTKFIIVVPSIAIKEGVIKSLNIMTKHFKELYNNVIFKSYEYNSKNLDILRDFVISDNIRILVMTVQAFNSNNNIINNEHEKTNGLKPIEFLKATNPFVIIDEPQSTANTENAQESIKDLNPLCQLRYSATHKKIDNLMFKLDAIDAYERQLVKQIEVSSIVSQNNNDAYMKLISVDNTKSPMSAKIEIDTNKRGKIKREIVQVKVRDDLFDLSNNREVYKDYIISEISCKTGNEFVSFSTKPPLNLNETRGEINPDIIKKLQIRKTIEEHLEKQLKLTSKGIKVLSLFFIDKVANYRYYDEEGKQQKGKYAIWFEEAYKDLIKLPKYNILHEDINIDNIHGGYFSKDNKGHFKDTRGTYDEDTYSLIMKDKEKLLSFNTKLRFIFSHSALKEGWDNPNVFQICTLNETKSTIKKRQEIGRGLRLAVNQEGNRVYGFDVNTLTIMANESYEDFSKKLQSEYEKDCSLKFGIVEKHIFANITIKKDKENKYLGQENSQIIWNYLNEKSFVDNKGKVTNNLKATLNNNTFDLPAEFEQVKDMIVKLLKKICGNCNLSIKNANDKQVVKLNKKRYLSSEFKELWNKIKYKTTFSVEFDSKELIEICAKEIRETINIKPPKTIYMKGIMEFKNSGITPKQIDKYGEESIINFNLPDIITYLQNETQLTRRTIIEILKKSNKIDDFKNNPQQFMDEVRDIIKRKMKYFIIDGIKYKKIGNDKYYSQELFKKQELYGYLSKNMLKSNKSVYDYVICDSGVESNFAKAMESNARVKVYAKLPSWFKIDTSLGSYNPDWAVFIEKHNEEKLYFVFETKGNTISEELRTKENAKIKCGEKHFKALNTEVNFIKSNNFDEVIENI